MSKSLRMKVWALYYEGYSFREIAEALDISEYEVVKIIRPAGY